MTTEQTQPEAPREAGSRIRSELDTFQGTIATMISPEAEAYSRQATTDHHLAAVRHAEDQFKSVVWNMCVHLSWQHDVEVVVARRGEKSAIGPVSVTKRHALLAGGGISRCFAVGDVLFAPEQVCSVRECNGTINLQIA